jgi:hypothetical protein
VILKCKETFEGGIRHRETIEYGELYMKSSYFQTHGGYEYVDMCRLREDGTLDRAIPVPIDRLSECFDTVPLFEWEVEKPEPEPEPELEPVGPDPEPVEPDPEEPEPGGGEDSGSTAENENTTENMQNG